MRLTLFQSVGPKQEEDTVKNQLFWAYCLAVIGITSIFAFYKLGFTLMNVDAQHWYARSRDFVRALQKGAFADTYQDPKPGVPVMWLSGLSLEAFLTAYEHKYGFRPFLYTQDTFYLVQLAALTPLVLVHLAGLLVFSYFARSVYGEKVTMLGLTLFAFQPFYLGNARFLHVDVTLATFMFLAFVTAQYFILTTKVSALLLSGFFLGLALSTKTQAVILFPLLIGMFCFAKIKPKVFTFWLCVTVFTFVVLFPAMWIHPLQTLTNIYSEAFHVASVGNTSRKSILYYFAVLPGLISFPVVVLALLGLIKSIATKLRPGTELSLVVVVYLGVMSLVTQKVDRYLLPLFPFLCLLAGLALVGSVKYVRETYLFLTVSVCALMILASHAPYYETFGMSSQNENYYGSLYSEVGEYLNAKPSPHNLTVVAMTKAYSLRPFVKGKVYGHEEEPAKKEPIDYLVTNAHWLSEYGPPDYFAECVLEKSIVFRGQTYWDIYNCSNK